MSVLQQIKDDPKWAEGTIKFLDNRITELNENIVIINEQNEELESKLQAAEEKAALSVPFEVMCENCTNRGETKGLGNETIGYHCYELSDTAPMYKETCPLIPKAKP
jgi:hypothetical protein